VPGSSRRPFYAERMTVASFVFSAIALALSSAAFGWQLLSWYLAGGRVRVGVHYVGPDGTGKVHVPPGQHQDHDEIKQHGGVCVWVHNRGRLPVYITGRGVGPDPKKSHWNNTWGRGPDIPHKLEPGDSVGWVQLTPGVRRIYSDRYPGAAPVFGAVRLSSGKYVHAKVPVQLHPDGIVDPTVDRAW
jgi:hypothetical protein